MLIFCHSLAAKVPTLSPVPKCEESQGTPKPTLRKIYSSTVRERPTSQPVCTSMMELYSSTTSQPTKEPSLQPSSKPNVKAESISSPTPKCEESQGTTPKPTLKNYSPAVRNRPTRQPVCTSMMESYSSSADTEATQPVRDEYPSRYGNNLFLDGESSRPSLSPTSAPIPPRVT